ncbi:MAG: hypothetical protein LBN39_13090 [Planctomycetaceae bacterium]|jgi:hypothetical protein|nr:hypothetical protein [Planctomycetaceae bacterium]
MKHIFLLLIIFTVVCFTACDNGKVPLSGRVTFSDDGSPLETGMVCFEANSFLARGTIGKDGKYIVGSTDTADGIPPGTYKVYVNGADKVPESAGGNGMATPVSLVAPKFTDGTTSGLTFTADGKTKVFDFKVDRAAVKK